MRFKLPQHTLYVAKQPELCRLTDYERTFIREWCEKRYLDDLYAVQALIYWTRVKAAFLVSFLIREKNHELYMLICTHLALKWHGYDEVFKCDFFRDAKEICGSLGCTEHQQMEIDVLRELQWELS